MNRLRNRLATAVALTLGGGLNLAAYAQEVPPVGRIARPSSAAIAPVHWQLSDAAIVGGADAAASVELHLEDSLTTAHALPSMQAACYRAGRPQKPCFERPGDIDRGDCPPERYQLNDCLRAGNPHAVAPWAQCSVNPHYSAWFVGGGTPWVLPRKSRPRTSQEGTWGLDYDGWFKPRRVWLNWSCDRPQGGLGAYATDGALPRLEWLKQQHSHHHEQHDEQHYEHE